MNLPLLGGVNENMNWVICLIGVGFVDNVLNVEECDATEAQ